MDLSDHVREEIVESVDILDILTGLRKHNILDNKDQENIYQASDRTQSKNYEVLFEIIKTKGDKAFWAFCHSLKNKAPVIYSNLHDISNVNARDNCPICIEEDGDFKCQYCLGSINVIDDPLITKPFHIADKILYYKTRNRELMDKYEDLDKEFSNIISEYRKSREKHQKDLSSKQKAIEEKENKLLQYLSKIEELKQKVDIYKEKDNYLAKRLTEEELTNFQQAEELEKVFAGRLDEQFYANERNVYRMKVKENVKLIQRLENEIRKLNEEKIKWESHLNMFRESLSRKKKELSSVNKSLESAEKESEELKEELSYYEKKSKEKTDIIQNKQKKIMDQEFKLQKANTSISTLRRQVEILSNADIAKEIQKLYDSNIKLSEEKDYLEIKLKNAEKDYVKLIDKYEKQLQEYQVIPSQLQEENETLLNSGGNISSLRKESDKDLHLERIDGTFGIVFTHYKSLALLDESNILVQSITPNNVVNTDVDHKSLNGAFVIAIQGKDVTNYNTKELTDLMKREREMCHLLVRPRRKPKHEILSLNLDNQTNGTLDKTTFHVFMRIKESSSAFNCGFKDFDEILQFGKKGKIETHLSKIRKSIEAALKKDMSCAFKIKRITNSWTLGRDSWSFSQSGSESEDLSTEASSVSDISRLSNQLKRKYTNNETAPTSNEESPAHPIESERSISPRPVSPRHIKEKTRNGFSSTIFTNSSNLIRNLHTTGKNIYVTLPSRTVPGIVSEEEEK